LKYFIAFIISIILHLGIYFLFIKDTHKEPINKSNKNNKSNTSKIQYIQLKPKVIVKDKKPKSKRIIQKKYIKTKPIPKIKPIKKKIITKPKIKSKLKEIVKKVVVKQEVLKEMIKPKTQKLDKQTQKLIDLYGDDFKKFDKQTKLYLIKNIKDIGEITKRFLSYPSLSIQAQQDGVNVIEFILQPNGSIKDVMVSKSSGYFMLDDNTMDTIYEAYEDYPKPKKPTLIKIFVKYELLPY